MEGIKNSVFFKNFHRKQSLVPQIALLFVCFFTKKQMAKFSNNLPYKISYK